MNRTCHRYFWFIKSAASNEFVLGRKLDGSALNAANKEEDSDPASLATSEQLIDDRPLHYTRDLKEQW